jgi:gamma-glutamylcyclotransferase (GGCT)/AIG2-like uncharacterized protein YtfP
MAGSAGFVIFHFLIQFPAPPADSSKAQVFRINYLYSMTGHDIHHLFVYGSLRSGFHSPAYEYISKYFDFIAEGRVKGQMFDLGSYPGAVPTTEEHYIIGELYKIKDVEELSWALAQLDDYEGVAVEEGEEQLYRREPVEVSAANQMVRAWIYWYNSNVEGRPLIASGDMMDYLSKKQ